MTKVLNEVVSLDNLNNANILISQALHCLEARLRYGLEELNCTRNVSDYLRLQLAAERSEVFAVLFLDSHHRLLKFEKLFYGSINEAQVYPRTVVQKALEHNAAKIIIAHNHPSGNCIPSNSDIAITRKLKDILEIVDVVLVDHFIVSSQNSYSCVEHGLL
jgi:DNA repair protein RadC